jgi:hypothetical protein
VLHRLRLTLSRLESNKMDCPISYASDTKEGLQDSSTFQPPTPSSAS